MGKFKWLAVALAGPAALAGTLFVQAEIGASEAHERAERVAHYHVVKHPRPAKRVVKDDFIHLTPDELALLTQPAPQAAPPQTVVVQNDSPSPGVVFAVPVDNPWLKGYLSTMALLNLPSR